MDAFLLKAYDLCNIGGSKEEKEWLQRLANQIQTYICKDSSSQNNFDISLSVLECLTNLKAKAGKTDENEISTTNDAADYGGSQDERVDNEPDNDDVTEAHSNALFELLCVADLIKSKDIIAGQIAVAGNNECIPSSLEELKDCRTLVPRAPSFLLGYLRCCPSQITLKDTPLCGSLFLEDNSGCLPIEVFNPDQSSLDQLVILPSWTFVPAPDLLHQSFYTTTGLAQNGYIEAKEGCLPVLAKVDNANLSSLIAPPCLSLTEYQNHPSTAKQKVNLHGKVTAVSPVHSMFDASKPFFFVQLTCTQSLICTPIVIQGAHLIHLFHFLQVDSEYIFTGLRETTMNKGTKNERKILASTRTTKMLVYTDGNLPTTNTRKRKTTLNVNDNISLDMPPKRSKGITGNAQLPTVQTTDQRSKIAGSRTGQPKVLSYKGVITKCFPRPHFGCYELDGKVRLYTVHQPCPYMGRGMRVGAEVSLYNVHPVKKGKEFLGLCCCTLSSVRVSKFSTFCSDWKPSVFSTSPTALHGQNMSLQDYVELTHACEKILEKFSKFERTSKLIGYSSSRQKSLQDKILKQSVIEKLLQECTTKSRFPRQPRNIYQEFFDHPHACCPTRNETLDLPMVYTIEELRGLVLVKSRRLPWQSGVVDVPSGEDDDWKFRVVDSSSICEKLVLLGYLKASSTTGSIKICDQTGKIAMHVGTTQTATKGNYNCRENLLDWKDCLIQVDKFDVVIESIQSCLFQTISGEKRTRIYIRTSLDCIKMLLPKKTPFHEATTENIGRELYKKATSNENIECSTGPEQQESLSNSKQALASEPSGSRDQAVTCEKPLSTCVFTCQLLFLVRHRENLQLKKKRKVMYACAVDVKVLAYSTNKMQGEDVPNNDLSRMVLKNKSLVLRLQSEAVVFLPFLHDGCFYLLTESAVEEGNSVAMSALNSNVKSVLNVTSSMDITLARVTKDVVTEECHATRERSEKSDVLKAVDEAREKFRCDEEDKMQSVEDVLSRAIHPDKGSKSEVKQVNFQGIIVRREMRQSDTCGQLLPNKNVVVPRFGALEQSLVNQMELGYGYLGNKTLFLRVQDLCTPNTIDVYVDLSTAPYIDGLLPGTVVCCRRFLRKVSRNSNVYCSFEACSSLTVRSSSFTDQISPQPSTSNVNPQSTLLSAVPNRFLIDLVEGESSGNRIHTISRCRCRVTAIQKVVMRWHCSKCSQVIEREECPRGCRSEIAFRFCAEARCLVEDGTSEALVYLSDDMVAVLLSLPSQELSRLKSFALSLGELVYQRHSYGFDGQNKNDNANLLSKQYEANRILTERCVSQQVRRSVILYCKPVGSIGRRIDRTDQEYDTRPIIINQTEHSTFVLPKLQVKVIEMAEVDYQDEIKRMLLAVDELCNDDK